MGGHPQYADSSIKNKFNALFEKINEPNYIMETYYSDNLINKIEETKKDTKNISYICNLLIDPLHNLEKYHVSVQVFLIKLLAFCVSTELYFTKIMSRINTSLSKAYSEFGSTTMLPSLSVAFLDVALALVEHPTGVCWLLESGNWKEILNVNNESKTVFVTRQKYKFVSKLVWKVNDLDDEVNMKQVLNFILQPLIKSEIVLSESITPEEEEETAKQFEPMLHMLHSILSDYSHLTKSSLVINALLNHFKVVPHVYILFDRFRKDSFTSSIAKLAFRLILAKILHHKPLSDNTVHTAEDFIETNAAFFNAVNMFISRRNAIAVLDYCYSCNEIWNAIWHNRKSEMSTFDGKKVDLQNKMLFMCLVPPLRYITRHKPCTANQEEGKIQDYIMKLIHATCDHTAKAATLLGDLTLETDAESITLQSVKRLTNLNNFINKEQANLMFQGLYYILKQFEPPIETNESSSSCQTPEQIASSWTMYQEDEENLFVYTYVLDAILHLVKNYDINWQESFEVLCLFNLVYNILKKPNLSTKFVVTALNAIALTVKKFLPPNLSLLMESKPGSNIHNLGRLIYMKMHDLHWEVRDSALELLLALTEISYIKFPPFQPKIIKNDLMVVATAVALNDHEFYARASALRCLAAACKVTSVWDHLKTKHPNIQESLLGVLRHNQEGIVRKEACAVLCEIYVNHKLTPAFKHELYEQMVSAAVSDFHWEVQLIALRFWKIVICTLLSEQGMLDGTFPPVTFSKETRKIVTLNKAEIQKRLLKLLDELAAIGCLTVLTKLLHDDTEVEIMDANLTISLNLLDILKLYEVSEVLRPAEGEPRTLKEFCSENVKQEVQNVDMVSKTEENEPDNVIDSIINSDDMNLLAHIYERHMKLQNDKPELLPKPMVKLLRYVSPYLYLHHLTSKDFKAVIEYKKQWRNGIRSVESLLDDVLGIYEVGNDVNDLDCY